MSIGPLVTVVKGVFDHFRGGDDEDEKFEAYLKKDKKRKAAAKKHAFAYKRITKTYADAMKATRPTSKKQQQKREYFAGVARASKDFDMFNEKKLAYLQDKIISDNDKYHISKGIDAHASSLVSSAIRNRFDIIDQPIDEEQSDITVKPMSVG